MSTDLERFRDHCRMMAHGGHTSACIRRDDEARQRWGYLRLFRDWPEQWGPQPIRPPKPCGGTCLSPGDRALFASLANEVDAYLTNDDAPLWEDA